MADIAEGWEGYCRIKLENNTDNWSRLTTNVSGTPYAKNPYVRSAPFDTDVAMERIYVIGSRTPVDTTEGVIDITGSIERPFFETATDNQFIWSGITNASTILKPYENTSHYTLAEVCGLYGSNVSKCMILVKPVSNQTFVLHSVKFHSYSFGLAQGETTTESADFTAKNISTS